jgi:hypothetical protein
VGNNFGGDVFEFGAPPGSGGAQLQLTGQLKTGASGCAPAENQSLKGRIRAGNFRACAQNADSTNRLVLTLA